MPLCNICGINLKPEWKACPNCDQSLKFTGIKPRIPNQMHQIVAKSGQINNGAINLIFSILALILFAYVFITSWKINLLPEILIFSIIAIVVGKRGMNYDDNPSIAKIRYILGIVGLVCFLILIFTFLALVSYSGCCVPEPDF